MISKIKLFLSIGAIIVLLSLITYHFITISKLKSEILNLKDENHKLGLSNFALNVNINTLNSAIKDQNEKIELLNKENEENMKKYYNWKSLSEDVKYNSLKNVLDIKGNKEDDECSIINNKLEAIKKLKFKDL